MTGVQTCALPIYPGVIFFLERGPVFTIPSIEKLSPPDAILLFDHFMELTGVRLEIHLISITVVRSYPSVDTIQKKPCNLRIRMIVVASSGEELKHLLSNDLARRVSALYHMVAIFLRRATRGAHLTSFVSTMNPRIGGEVVMNQLSEMSLACRTVLESLCVCIPVNRVVC